MATPGTFDPSEHPRDDDSGQFATTVHPEASGTNALRPLTPGAPTPPGVTELRERFDAVESEQDFNDLYRDVTAPHISELDHERWSAPTHPAPGDEAVMSIQEDRDGRKVVDVAGWDADVAKWHGDGLYKKRYTTDSAGTLTMDDGRDLNIGDCTPEEAQQRATRHFANLDI